MTYPPPHTYGIRLVILAVHGFPQSDIENRKIAPGQYLNPCLQLLPIREAIESSLVPTSESLAISWLDCPWILGESVEKWPKTLLWDEMDSSKHTLAAAPGELLGRTGTFSNMYLAKFDMWLQEQITEESQHETNSTSNIAIICYSGGGLLVYRWLAERASEDLLKQISSIFCVASPFNFRPHQTVRFTVTPDNRGLSAPISVDEPSVNPLKIIEYLQPRQLVVILAKEDRTILTENSSFLEMGFQAPQIVEHDAVDGANHLTILDHPATKKHIIDHLDPLI